MKKLIVIVILFCAFGLEGQPRLDSATSKAAYISKKETYKIEYDLTHWRISNDSTKWEIEFHDSNDLVKAYFSAFNYFIPSEKLKKTIKSQYDKIGKVKKLRTYKKKLTHMEVDYFECELTFKGYVYKYEGFVHGGQRGSMSLHFGGQVESISRTQKLINEFCNGVLEIR